MEDRKGKALSFLLGLIVGNKVVPLLVHCLYWGVIILLVIWKFIP